MDYMAFNKALLNQKRIYKLDTKTMVFVVGSVRVGEVSIEVRFPHTGRIVDVYATCYKEGVGKTVIDVEKCAQLDYDSYPNWISIFTDKILTIPNAKKSSATETYELNALASQVNENDHFRLNIKEVGLGISDITVEVVVELDVELK